MRTFLALPVYSCFRSEIETFLKKAVGEFPDVKWTRPENVHITVHFFGNTTDGEVSRIREIISPLARNLHKPEVRLSGIGFFPNNEKPNVIWIGVGKGHEEVCRIYSQIAPVLKESGFPVETRPFRPHATVGRTRAIRKKEAAPLAALGFESKTSGIIEELVLYESLLEPEGVRYQPLTRFALE